MNSCTKNNKSTYNGDHFYSVANSDVYINVLSRGGREKIVNGLKALLIHVYCTTVFPSGILGTGTRYFGMMYDCNDHISQTISKKD